MHLPHRGDAIEAWIKSKRDEHGAHREDSGSEAWTAVDNLLDDYRLAADTGEAWAAPDGKKVLDLHLTFKFDPAKATADELLKEARGLVVDASCYTDRRRAFDALCLADTFASMATAAAMLEQHFCGHGTRGWCPHCHHNMKNGMAPS